MLPKARQDSWRENDTLWTGHSFVFPFHDFTQLVDDLFPGMSLDRRYTVIYCLANSRSIEAIDDNARDRSRTPSSTNGTRRCNTNQEVVTTFDARSTDSYVKPTVVVIRIGRMVPHKIRQLEVVVRLEVMDFRMHHGEGDERQMPAFNATVT